MNDFADAPAGAPRPEKKGMGCFFWGCLITGIVILLLVVAIPTALYFGARYYVHKITSPEPAEIQIVELPEEQLAEIQARFEAFTDAMEGDGPPPELEITAEELNGLINQNPDVAGKIFIRIQDGQVGGDVSFPLDDFPLPVPGKGGRYFNAKVDLKVSMEDGELDVRLAEAEVNGEPIPAKVRDAISEEYLADEIDDPDAREAIEKFDSIEIVGDKIILRPKQEEAKAAPSEEPQDAEVEVPGEIESFEEAAEPAAVESP